MVRLQTPLAILVLGVLIISTGMAGTDTGPASDLQGGSDADLQGGSEADLQGGSEADLQGGSDADLQGGSEADLQGGEGESALPPVRPISGGGRSNNTTEPEDKPFISYSATVLIEPGDDFFVLFDQQERTLRAKNPPRLPDECWDAVEMVPDWLKVNLTHKFNQLSGDWPIIYADLIRESPEPEWRDEIAFCVAHSAVQNLQDEYMYPELLTHNAQLIYDADQYLDYVDIVEKDGYTTVKYVDGDGKNVLLDRDLYYWYIVHPKLSDEQPTYVDPEYDYTSEPPFDRNAGTPPPVGRYWRDMLFYENDTGGYPVLRERLMEADTVWEAIGACNGWMGGSMSFTSDNERPVQPVRIYRKHIGRCGEYQDMRNAIARAGLIPSTCTLNSAEDHVWNEFWDGRWIHWDGDVDHPLKYEQGWGKTISSVWNTRGDGHIDSVTAKYTEGLCGFTAEVLDGNGDPVDGALITISTENFYYPDVHTTTTWGTTDYTGKVTVPLGDGRNFWAEADTDDLGDDPINGEAQIIWESEDGGEYEYTFEVPFSADALRVSDAPPPGTADARFFMEARFEVRNNILSEDNAYTNEHGDLYGPGGDIDFFIADERNYDRYQGDRNFAAHDVHIRSPEGGGSLPVARGPDHFVVLSNLYSQATAKLVNITVDVYAERTTDITYPENGTVGDLGGELRVDGGSWSPYGIETVEYDVDGAGDWAEARDTSSDRDDPWSAWSFGWDTAGAGEGEHTVLVRALDVEGYLRDSVIVTLVDGYPPVVEIYNPADKMEFDLGETIRVDGTAEDDVGVALLEMALDGDWDSAVDITYELSDGYWRHDISTTGWEQGYHTIAVRAFDNSTNTDSASTMVKIVETELPSVAIHSPGDGALYDAGEDILITGIASDNDEVAGLAIRFDGGSAMDITGNLGEDGTWTYSWTPGPSVDDGRHTIEVTAEDPSGNEASAGIEVRLDGTAPEGLITYPAEGQVLASSEGVVIEGTASDAVGLASATLTFDGYDTVDITKKIWNGEWTYDAWDIGRLASGQHTVELSVTDEVGHGTADSLTVIVDAEDPEVEVYKVERTIILGDIAEISGTASDDIGIASLTISVDGGDPVDITSRLYGTQWTYNWNTEDEKGGLHTIEVRAVDRAGNTADADEDVRLFETVEEAQEYVPPDKEGDEGGTYTGSGGEGGDEGMNWALFGIAGLIGLILLITLAATGGKARKYD